MIAMDDYTETAKESEGPIRDALSRCESVLHEIHKTSEELAMRLSPVLTPSSPQVEGQSLEAAKVEGSPLQNRLNELEDNLRDAVKRLDRLIQRVAL